MQKFLLLKLLIAIIATYSYSTSAGVCYEDTLVKKYMEYSQQYLFVSAYAPDSSTLPCEADQIMVQASWYKFLFDDHVFPWKKKDWLTIRVAKPQDMQYIDTMRYEEVCPGKMVKGKYNSISNRRPDCLVGPPIVSKYGYYTNIDENVNFSAVNKFAIKVGDSSAIALNVDTLFDGEHYGPNRRNALDMSKVEKITYDVIVETKSLKKNPARMQFSDQFESYPEFTLYHFTDDWGMFILQGKAIDSDVIMVYEFTISPTGVTLKKEFTDLFIGDEAIHQTDYFIEGGVLKRKVMSLDEKSRHPHYNKAKFDQGWLPDN